MVLLNYVGKHQKKGEVEVKESKVEALLKTGNYELVGDQPTIPTLISEKSRVPNASWTEKSIKKWIKDNNIPVEYNIKSETKSDKLKELEDKGYI